MKKRALWIMIIVLAVAGPLPAQESKGPRIEITEMRHDFGKVVQGTQVSHTFEIRSVGSETLEIERVSSS